MPWKITKLLTTTSWDKAENVTNSNEQTVSIGLTSLGRAPHRFCSDIDTYFTI
jgi:hypothetical protein